MKTFSQFILEADSSASDASSAISRSGSGVGSSDADGPRQGGFKKRRLPIEFKKKEREVTEPGEEPNKDTVPGEEPNKDTVDTPRDRQPAPYRQVNKTATQKPSQERPALPAGKERPSLPAGKERPALSPSKDSMVAKRIASAQQSPQHKQISARPASTAMAGSRQRPAIRPASSNLSRNNQGVQRANVRDLGSTPQKKLSPTPQKRLNPAQQRQLPPARS